MGWLALARVVLVSGVFGFLLPALAFGKKRAGPVIAFVQLAFLLQLILAISAQFQLALAGTALLCYVAWLSGTVLSCKPELLRSPEPWGIIGIGLIRWFENFLRQWDPQFLTRFWTRLNSRRYAAPFLFLAAALFVQQGWFPVNNLRFLDSANYSRSLSLAVLSSGHVWTTDLSVPLLLPISLGTGLPATAVVALASPLFAVLFVLSSAFAARELLLSRSAALFTAALAAAVTPRLSTLASADAASMAATFLVLGLGLSRRSLWNCGLAVLTGASIATAGQAAAISTAVWLVSALAALLLGMLACRIANAVDRDAARPLATAVVTAVAAIVFLTTQHQVNDGPHQYEAAARFSERIASSRARNSWLIVSPAQELPYVYGRGWHMEIRDVVAQFSPAQAANPAFRFPYQVRDIFFFIERHPLNSQSSGSVLSNRIDVVFDPAARDYSLPAARAGIEYMAGELLAAYASTHSGVSLVHSDDHFVVYQITGESEGKLTNQAATTAQSDHR